MSDNRPDHIHHHHHHGGGCGCGGGGEHKHHHAHHSHGEGQCCGAGKHAHKGYRLSIDEEIDLLETNIAFLEERLTLLKDKKEKEAATSGEEVRDEK